MSYLKYIYDHILWVFIWIFLIASIEIFLLTLSGVNLMMLYIPVGVTIALFIGTYIDYRKTKVFVSEVVNLADTMDKTYLLPEVMDFYTTRDQELIAEVLRQMENSMADNIAQYRRTCEEYKEYIETWVHEVKIPIATAGIILENHKDEIVKNVGVDKEIKRIQDYVEQALFFARSEAVEKDYLIKEINLEEVVMDVISDKKRILREKRAGIDIHDMEISKTLCSDKKWLVFIIGQIISNSIKYAREDKNLTLEIFATESDSDIRLHIRDNGIGMKDGEKDRIFDKGFTGSNGRNISSSTGMGLYLCKKLCNRLEHDIEAESTEGEGTDMMIVFSK